MSGLQSRMLIGDSGAEMLGDAGAAIFRANSIKKPVMLTTPLITEAEIDESAATTRQKYPAEEADSSRVPAEQYWKIHDAGDSDDLYDEAAEAVREAGKASTSYLQRKLGIGYARASTLMDLLETNGVIGPAYGSKPRELLSLGKNPSSSFFYEK